MGHIASFAEKKQYVSQITRMIEGTWFVENPHLGAKY